MSAISKTERDNAIKFLINMFIAAITLSIFITCILVAAKLLTGGITYTVLQDAGLFFIVVMTLCLSSGTAFFLFTYCREIRKAFSIYRFYKTLIGHGSLGLLTETYQNVTSGFNVPIKAQHTDGTGNIVQGQWNDIGDWQVNGKKTTKKWSRNEKWQGSQDDWG